MARRAENLYRQRPLAQVNAYWNLVPSQNGLSLAPSDRRLVRVAGIKTEAAEPGIPDFFSRRRFVDPGLVALSGRAWSGNGPIERVEVAVDGQWADATLATPVGEFAWRGWSFDWDATTAHGHSTHPRHADLGF